MSKGPKPAVLFVCVKNGGKSQMAAALMRQTTGETVDVYSAGTNPGAEINALSAASLAEVGVDISDEKPKPIDPDLLWAQLGTGKQMNLQIAGSRASNACGWFATTSLHA